VGTDQIPVTVKMRLGVYLGGGAESSPPQLEDCPVSGHILKVIFFSDFLDSTGILPEINYSLLRDGRGPYGVIAAVG
jgi:hypothetical protein